MSRRRKSGEVELKDRGRIERKIEAILSSKMPANEKSEYIDNLVFDAKAEFLAKADVNRVSFAVYAKIRKIKKSLLDGMVAFPKAQGVALASLEEWDEIYKSF